jgi:hypothetical protein
LGIKKSRIHWLKEGDKNSKLFHNSLLQRRSQNIIASIISTNGIIKEKQDDIEEYLTSCYNHLLLYPNTNIYVVINKIIEAIHHLVSLE